MECLIYMVNDEKIIDGINPDILKDVQVLRNFKEDLDPKKKKVFIVDTLPNDPEVLPLKEKWKVFDKIVFKSFLQKTLYNTYFDIPHSAGTVIRDAVNPMKSHTKTKDTINIVYHAEPYVGLDLVYIAFRTLAADYENLKLDIYTAKGEYAWSENDETFSELFRLINEHPQITNYGHKSPKEVRDGLENGNIFVAPGTIMQATNERLLEAMSAGLICVHSSHGALPELGMNLTYMYEYTEDKQQHLNMLHHHLKSAIESVLHPNKDLQNNLELQKNIIDTLHDINYKSKEWEKMFKGLLTT